MRGLILALMTLAVTLIPALAARADDPDRAFSGRFLLVDMNGRTVSDETYAGKVRLVSFGYTYCPDICPTTLNTLSAALDQLGADKDKVATLFISIDPERDTPAHLKEYLASFPGITGLSGTPEQVAAAARNLKARYQKQPAENGDPAAYSMDHSSSILILDRAGNFLARMPHASAPDRLVERVRGYLQPKAIEGRP
ncbi:SCO family protein [Paramagnetospirillum marisnigri]|nr:SCO family protein [Paramagnetospirillum marisnigri]